MDGWDTCVCNIGAPRQVQHSAGLHCDCTQFGGGGCDGGRASEWLINLRCRGGSGHPHTPSIIQRLPHQTQTATHMLQHFSLAMSLVIFFFCMHHAEHSLSNGDERKRKKKSTWVLLAASIPRLCVCPSVPALATSHEDPLGQGDKRQIKRINVHMQSCVSRNPPLLHRKGKIRKNYQWGKAASYYSQ